MRNDTPVLLPARMAAEPMSVVDAPPASREAPASLRDRGRVAASIVAFGAGALVPMAAVEQYRSELQRAGRDFEIHTYPSADHGWTNPKLEPYRQEAAEDCWDKARKFITKRIAARQEAVA